MNRYSLVYLALAAMAALGAGSACSDSGKLNAPKSDSNFDDEGGGNSSGGGTSEPPVKGDGAADVDFSDVIVARDVSADRGAGDATGDARDAGDAATGDAAAGDAADDGASTSDASAD